MVQAAFGTELHRFRVGSEVHFGPAYDLRLPANLASVTAAVLHLSDFRPQPQWKSSATARPTFTSLAAQAHLLTPKDVLTMYDANDPEVVYNSGSSQGLVVVGQSYVETSSSSQGVWAFQAQLTQLNLPIPVLVPGSGPEAIAPGDEGESEIDLEYASGVNPTANVFLVYVGANQNYNVYDALAYAITERIAPVISISYGTCEALMSQADLAQYSALFEEASAQGQTLIASSGDSGSTACAPFTGNQGLTAAEQQALSVSFPASSPNVTAVGGTQMAAGTFAPGSNSYWAGASVFDTVSSLLSYVPEVVWNEGSASAGIAAGGGGSSSYYARPDWQTKFTGMPAGTQRLVPDIALQSSLASPGFLICTTDPELLSEEGQTSSCGSGLLGSNHQYTVAGGTSFAAPIFAGLLAKLNAEENASGQGNINPILYTIAGNPESYTAAFHDITAGSIACSAGASHCGSDGQSNYPALAGYDEASGLGSIDFHALEARWPVSSSAQLQSTSILLEPAQSSANPGDTIPVQIYVAPGYLPSGNTPPQGTISVSVDGAVAEQSLQLTASPQYTDEEIASYNFLAPQASGSHVITVSYPGDATHSPATATTAIMVGTVVATGGISLAVDNLTVANGQTGTTKVTITPSGNYEGRLVWSLAASSSSSASGELSGCYGIPSSAVNGLTTVTLSLGVGTACKSTSSGAGAAIRMTHDASRQKPADPGDSTTTVFAASLLICGCLAGFRRRSGLSCGMLLLVGMAGAGLTGCGGGSGHNNTSGPPTTQTNLVTYTMTLTGKDSVNGAITASATFTLTVD